MLYFICILLLVLTGCQQKPQERRYTELVMPAPERPAVDPHAGLDMSSMEMPPTANNAMKNILAWKTPQGWQETPGRGMRLASFHLMDHSKTMDCSIVSLGGMAGGLEANLRRWMGQIGITPSEEDFTKLINSSQSVKTQSGAEAKIYDFTAVQNKTEPSAKSIIAAMISMDEATVFVKMTGTVEDINYNKSSFLELVQSLHHQ